MKQTNFRATRGGVAQGTVAVPGDKSISHRALLLGAIAEGETHIRGFLPGEDNLSTLKALQACGVPITRLDQTTVHVQGVGLRGLKPAEGPLDCGNSGTLMRLFTGILAGQSFDSVLVGDESLSKRPMKRIMDPLAQMGAHIMGTEQGTPPLKIQGNPQLRAITYTLPMASAQVKSAILLAGLYATGETTLIAPAVSRDHTERMLRAFQYPITVSGLSASVQGGSVLRGAPIVVPGDLSSAAFLMVAASIIPGSDVTVTRVGVNPTRTGVIDILRAMGADLTITPCAERSDEPMADIRIRYAPLKGIEIAPHLVPLAIDEFPIIFIAAACAEGVTTVRGAEELRVKETDRLRVMAEGLAQLGLEVTLTADGLSIQGGPLQGSVIDSHGDHRIAMAFAIAGCVAHAPIEITQCHMVETSFPGFVPLVQSIGLQIYCS
ncbi:MAG: 3-phosphoshikimate 1-carboxyvinyltransferase [Gammaproteobacteria bacterium RIFCSPHIGHO2_12_FULL_45_9]|nr:MAG: 3-phosphoshikimate 1-carboxyvinyltransferase [Gammaproteobacteria bacterium RIFCSPHIGHO2_12_FULL_45_9]